MANLFDVARNFAAVVAAEDATRNARAAAEDAIFAREGCTFETASEAQYEAAEALMVEWDDAHAFDQSLAAVAAAAADLLAAAGEAVVVGSAGLLSGEAFAQVLALAGPDGEYKRITLAHKIAKHCGIKTR